LAVGDGLGQRVQCSARYCRGAAAGNLKSLSDASAGSPGKPWIGCDGGGNFWGAVYDVESGMFADFALNGSI
jgi:hypothetical protein